jgi:hypothetical protein
MRLLLALRFEATPFLLAGVDGADDAPAANDGDGDEEPVADKMLMPPLGVNAP